MLNWSLNNYLGLANDPEVRKLDAEVAQEYGFSHPMGARMMSGNTDFHEKLEDELEAIEEAAEEKLNVKEQEKSSGTIGTIEGLTKEGYLQIQTESGEILTHVSGDILEISQEP